MAAKPSGTKPSKVFRDRSISVSIFPNEVTIAGKKRVFHSVSIERSYKDGEDFKATHKLDKEDLPVVHLLIAQAWEWIVNEEATQRKKPVE